MNKNDIKAGNTNTGNYLTPTCLSINREQVLGKDGRAVYRGYKPIFKREKGIETEKRIGSKIYAMAIDNGNILFEVNCYSEQPFTLPENCQNQKLKFLYISEDLKGKFYEYKGGLRFTSYAKEVRVDV